MLLDSIDSFDMAIPESITFRKVMEDSTVEHSSKKLRIYSKSGLQEPYTRKKVATLLLVSDFTQSTTLLFQWISPRVEPVTRVSTH